MQCSIYNIFNSLTWILQKINVPKKIENIIPPFRFNSKPQKIEIPFFYKVRFLNFVRGKPSDQAIQ